MVNLNPLRKVPLSRRAAALVVAALLLVVAGACRTKSQVAVPQLLTPLAEADTGQLVAEINRQAAVRSLSGRVDIQFLDTSFAECGIAEKYRTADGRVIVQRPGQIYLEIKAPLVGVKIAEMSSDGEHFWAALYQGDEKYRRFVFGTNNAVYPKLEADGQRPDCGGGGKRQQEAMQRATVSAISSLRPQHFTDALLVPPVSTENSDLLYARSETFEEEADARPGAKRGARVVRGYYLLVELKPDGANNARLLRRFWFDRVGGVRLARIQTYDEQGRLVTDVFYREPKNLGEGGRRLASQVELTRPQDRYSVRLAFQEPEGVVVDKQHDREIFVLPNNSNLPEYNLDARK